MLETIEGEPAGGGSVMADSEAGGDSVAAATGATRARRRDGTARGARRPRADARGATARGAAARNIVEVDVMAAPRGVEETSAARELNASFVIPRKLHLVGAWLVVVDQSTRRKIRGHPGITRDGLFTVRDFSSRRCSTYSFYLQTLT